MDLCPRSNLSGRLAASRRDLKLELTVKQKDELKHAFDLLDRMGEGTIDISDVAIAFRALGLEVTQKEMLKIVRRYDPQRKGMLPFTFSALLSRYIGF